VVLLYFAALTLVWGVREIEGEGGRGRERGGGGERERERERREKGGERGREQSSK
jgi:hypothetical protein